jgi:hypothetical protein
MGIKMYNNMIWEILDDDSKLYILSILTEQGFQGDCKLISVVDGDTTIMEVTDAFEHRLILPINILDILNS